MASSSGERMFVPLHVKSDYSIGYGTASVEEVVRRAAEFGYRSLALTDLENLYGQVRFHHECRMRGIRAITGVELRPGFYGSANPGSRSGRVVLLARNPAGYRSLCRIVSLRRTGGGGGDPLPVLQRFPEGLIVLSDDPGPIDFLLRSHLFPPDRLGIFALRPGSGPGSAGAVAAHEFAAASGVRLVADLDVVFPAASDHRLHLLQLAVAQGRLLDEVAQDPDAETSGRALASPDAAAHLFADLPQAVAASEEIAGLCDLQLGASAEKGRGRGAASDDDDHRELTSRCLGALSAVAQGRDAGAYRDRLEAELVVFGRLRFSGFMLIVARILGHCRESGIPVAIRGSAVSSLVLHLLGGSPVDPLEQGLLFERFLHAGKSAWPDVDIDLPWHRRDEVIDWVYREFGEERVAMVAAHHTFRHRSALREGLKAFGLPLQLVDAAARAVPVDVVEGEEEAGEDSTDGAFPHPLTPSRRGRGDSGESANEGYAGSDRWKDAARVLPERAKRALPLIRRLVGRPRHIAAHPGGIIIEREPLRDLVPLERAPKGVVVTQYDLVAVAELGLVKIDLLGNRCLSEVEEALTLAGWPKPVRLSGIPAEDPTTLELIDRAETVGCFQLESPAMRSLLGRLPIRRQSDIVAALALIRPGAASGEVKETFLRRARGEEAPVPVFPVLADRLGDSYGLFIYEEDIMVLLSRIGGLTLGEADEMRRGIVKSGGDPDVLASLQKEFLGTARLRQGDNGRAIAQARRAWSVAVRFAAYSFNKSHAASYALLAYYSAYVKTHHPVEFACALLNHHQGLYPLRVEVAELAREGVRFLAPQVNASAIASTLEGPGGKGAVRVGLGRIKGLSRRAAQGIVAERAAGGDFRSLGDLLKRVRLGANEVKALVLCGACDGLPPLEDEGYPILHEAVLERLAAGGAPAELDASTWHKPVAAEESERERLRLYQGLVRVRNELAYLEMHLAAHPVELLRREAERFGCVDLERAKKAQAGGVVTVVAVLAAMRRVQTRQGVLLFLTLQDETGLLEAVLFPNRYREVGRRATAPGPFLVKGRVRVQQGVPHLDVSDLRPFHEREGAYRL